MKSNKRTGTAKWVESKQHWRIDVRKDGERKTFYCSTPGRTGQRECNAKADKWLKTGIAPRGQGVEDAYMSWIADRKKATSESNWRPIIGRWKKWVLPEIGKLRLSKLNDGVLQDVINTAYAAGKSKKTLQNICADLRSFCKFCRKHGLSDYEPNDIIIPAGARYKGKDVLQPKELKTLFSQDETVYRGKRVPDEYVYAYRFQALTGLRPGELKGLRWTDIVGNVVHIRGAINFYGEKTRGKNENSIRSFVLTDMALSVLARQKELTGEEDFVFGIRNQRHYLERWKAYTKANGMNQISTYELRHTFVSAVKTLPDGAVKDLVGHSQDMDTFGVYSHAMSGDAEDTARAIDGIFKHLLER